MRRLGGVVLALALVSCDLLPSAAPKAPSGPIGVIAQNVATLLAPGPDVMDARFDSFLADMDLAKALGTRADEVTAQIRSGRASVTKPKSSGVSGGGRLASVRRVFGESIVFDFAATLAGLLDELTKASGTKEFPPLAPTSSTDVGPESVTTSSQSQTRTASSTGARVSLTIVWTYRETTKDKKSGATLVEIVEDRTMVGAITVCPDPVGAVVAVLDVKGQFTGVTNGQTTTLTTTSSSVFTGYANDSATLGNVTQVLQDKQSWEASSGSGSYDAIFSMSSRADATGKTSGDFDASSASGSVNSSDAAAGARATRAMAWSFVLNGHSLDESYQKAQRLWRNGRCVMVLAPDYGAETPIEVAKQQEAQNDETVDVDSETKVSVNLKHRFSGGALAQPVLATLATGGKKLEPARLESVPSVVTYKAPAEQDKKATVQLTSTSKRGIGTLVLDFHTGGEGLTLTINGTLTLVRRFIGTVEVTDRVQIGPVEFKKKFEDTWEGTGTWQAQTRSVVSVAGTTQTCTGSQSGTITMLATHEDRGGKKVWVVNPLDGSAGGTASSSCPGEITIEADAAEQFLGAFDPIVIPEEGGVLAIHGTRGSAAVGQATGEGTVSAKTKH